MTDTPLPQPVSGSLKDDPVWQAAMDWLLQCHSAPDDALLQQAHARWLAADERHAVAWRKAEKVWLLSGGLAPLEPPVPQPLPTPLRARRNRPRRALKALALAACLLLLAGPTPPTAHTSPAGEHRQVLLSDGSRIELGSDSAIRVDFEPGTRAVTLLRGQAFFEVSHDASRPFTVQAADVKVRVIGTAFDVDLSRTAVVVAVQSGAVQVRDGRGELAVPALGPGDSLRLGLDQGPPQRGRLLPGQVAPWRQWQLLVNDRPLSEVVEALQDYYPGVLLLTDPALGERRITASLNLRSPVSALQLAIAPLGGHLRQWGPYLTLIRKEPQVPAKQ
ncbi:MULTISPECIES: FecR family protein [Pseudomonas]|uniref:FecR family protein n=1 Tax=Pseudomonas TaxID=286 RepID=UPI000876CDAF|nr:MULTISPECIES: FecR domain-containing protein [Pseudomonas]MCU1765542.1 FecR domain-containing protein [Pseudomonas protegens]SCZ75697.1 FecR family protein [Pseudomonas sp. NFPP17]SDA38775.1 FecR family protein [Pseudomonas sp. NFPP15]SEK50321.1 FecR family protein [Pseudomonas sp. NFPP18]SFA68444.1 FecR family protein [Pseudomonas sp. NFPP13]